MLEKKKVIKKVKRKSSKLYTATPTKNILVGKRLLTKHVTYKDVTKTELDTLKKCKAI